MASLKSPASKSPAQTVLLDQTDANNIYLGVAKMGEATNVAQWQIRKIATSGGNVSIKYANGSDAFNQIWDNRASLTYS